MNFVNKSLAGIFQPFLKKTFTLLLGEFIDQNGINFEDLTLNGIKNLQLDVEKINQKYFQNSHLLMEKCQLNSIKIYFSFQKKIQVIIESVECGFYINEDISKKEQYQESNFKQNFNKKKSDVQIKIENNKKILDTIQNYQIEINLKDIQIIVKPARPTLELDYFTFHIGNIQIIKNPTKKSETQQDGVSFIVQISIDNTSLFLQKKKTCDQSMVNQQTQKQRYNIFQQQKPLKFELEIMNKGQEFNLTLRGSIDQITIILNYQIIGLFMIFYQKIMNFEQSKLILNEDWENLESLTKSHATYLADKFASNFDSKFEQIFQSFDFKFAQNFGCENPFSMGANMQQVIKVYAKIVLKKVNIILYEQNEFNDIQINIKEKCLENGYIDIFPFENYQIIIDETEFVFKQNSQMMHVKNIQVSNLKRTQNSKKDSQIVQNMNNSSALLQSMIEESYEIKQIFNLNQKQTQKSTENILQNDSILNFEFQKARKNSIEPNQIKKDIDKGSKSLGGISIKLQNKTFCCLVTNMEIIIDEFLIIIQQIIHKLNQELDNQIQDSTLVTSMLRDFDLKMYYKEFQKLNHKLTINDLQKRFIKIEKKDVLIFDLPFNIIFCIRNFLISSSSLAIHKILTLQNLQLNLVDLKQLNRQNDKPFMNLETINILDQIEIKNINSSISNYDPVIPECNITTVFNQMKGIIDMQITQTMLQDKKLQEILQTKTIQQFSKLIQILKEIQDELVGLYEIDQQKIQINGLLSEIAAELMPKMKVCSFFKGSIRNIDISVIDTNDKTLCQINDYLSQPSSNQVFFQDLDYSQISEKRYEQIDFLKLNIDSVDFTINDKTQKIQIKNFNAKSINIWSNQNQEYFAQISIDNLIAKNQTKVVQVQLNNLFVKVDSSQKRINIFKNIFQFYIQQIIKYLPCDQSPQQKDQKNTQKTLELNANSIEIILQEFLINLKINLTNIKLDNQEFYAPYTQISKLNYAQKNEQSILEIYSFSNLSKENQAKIKNINIKLDMQIIKVLNEFSEYIQKNIKEFLDIYAECIQKQSDLCEEQCKDDSEKFQSFTTQGSQIQQVFENFELVGQFWDIFMSFKQKVKINQDKQEAIQLLKQFLQDHNQEKQIENQFQIDEVKIQILDDVIDSEYILQLQKFCLLKTQFVIGTLEKFQFFIKQDYNQQIVLENLSDKYALKFLFQQEDSLNFYLGLGTLNFQGKQKLWEVLDKRLKIELKNFYSSKKQKEEEEIQQDFELVNSDISQTIGEVLIDAFKMIINISKQKVIFDIEETNSLEIYQEDKMMEDIIQLLLQKILKSAKKSCLQLHFLSGTKIILFFFWRIFTFVVLRKNIVNLNKGFYKLVKDKIKKTLNSHQIIIQQLSLIKAKKNVLLHKKFVKFLLIISY